MKANEAILKKYPDLRGTPAEGWTGKGDFPGFFKQTTRRASPVGAIDADKVVYFHEKLREGRRTPAKFSRFAMTREESAAFAEASKTAGFAVVGNFQPGSATTFPFSLSYKQEAFVGDMFYPVFVGGPDLKADYFQYGKEIYQLGSSKKAFGQKSSRMDINFTPHTIKVGIAHKEVSVEQAEREAGVFLSGSIDTKKVNVLKKQLALEREYDQITTLLATGSYAATFYASLAGPDLWSDDSSDPVAEFFARRRKVTKSARQIPDLFGLSPDAENALATNKAVRELVKYTGTLSRPAGYVSGEGLAMLFRTPIITAGAGVAASVGAAVADMWAQSAVLLCTGGTEDDAQRAGVTATAPGYPFFDSYPDKETGSKGATVYKYADAWTVDATLNNAAGYLWKVASKEY